VITLLTLGLIKWDRIILFSENPEKSVWKDFISWVRECIEDRDFDYREENLIDPDYACTVVGNIKDIPNIKTINEQITNVLIVDEPFDKSAHSIRIMDRFWNDSRQRSMSCFYLSQEFYDGPKVYPYGIPKSIRIRSSCFILFGGIPNIGRITNDVILSSTDKEEFRGKYNQVIDEKYQFLVVDRNFGVNKKYILASIPL
jgi:hypothetical protein